MIYFPHMTDLEIKPCWKCRSPLIINEYGYAICYNNIQHVGGDEAVVFGDKDPGSYKTATEPDPEAWKRRYQGLTYQQSYYWRKTKKKRMEAQQKKSVSTL